MLVVTTEGIPGYEVRAVIGEVVGVTARSLNPYVEGVKSLNARLNPHLVRMLAQIRQEAVAHMVEAANRRGANAIVGMRFDHRDVSAAWNEVCAYGTAVVVDLPMARPPQDPPITDRGQGQGQASTQWQEPHWSDAQWRIDPPA